MCLYLWVAFLRGIFLYSSGNQRLQGLEVTAYQKNKSVVQPRKRVHQCTECILVICFCRRTNVIKESLILFNTFKKEEVCSRRSSTQSCKNWDPGQVFCATRNLGTPFTWRGRKPFLDYCPCRAGLKTPGREWLQVHTPVVCFSHPSSLTTWVHLETMNSHSNYIN